ncbi:SusD/RagB family nutrient-binding outer membrane lipoprotein [Flavitalea sp.]|nr:SusD/RagB family nutrient-binding outer membrane lipoprotein [Flavitalea sp.]
MRNIKNIARCLLALGIISISSCAKKIDEAFINPNAGVKKPIETLLPGIIGNMVGSSAAAGSAYGTANDGIYIGRYVQFWATNVTGNQYDQMGGATGALDILGSVWAMHYFGMGQNLNRIIEWGTEEKKWDYVGVAHAIKAWSWLTLTNVYGEVILTEAFNTSQLTFKYNDQADVYDTVRSVCRTALSFLNQTGDGVDAQNLAKGDAYFYNGDVNKWKKFVYSVMARSFNQLSNKTTYNADSVLFYCNLAINVNSDNAYARFANTGITGTSNYFGPFRGNVGALRQAQYPVNLLTGLNSRFPGVVDPRAPYLLRQNTNGTYRGIVPNKGASGLVAADRPENYWGQGFDTVTSPTSDAKARYIFRNAAYYPIITAAEIQFMKAEAYYRKGEKPQALTAYQAGIGIAFDMLTADFNANIPPAQAITPTSKAAYLGNPVIVPSAANLKLSHIMLQKYLALYGYGSIEVWNDMRRFHYTDQEGAEQVFTDFTPPAGTDLFINNNNKLVYRARPRYNSEYLYNIAELDRLGALALDYNTKEQWFTQK